MASEFALIARYFSPRTTHTVLAGGDDAALVSVAPGMELAVSTDMLVGGRHFFAKADAYGVGHKSLAVNLSDLAAMGATPRWVTLSLALPSADEPWIEAFAAGFLDLAAEHRVDLVGGDTTGGPLNICVQIMGEVPAGQALRRTGARPGDGVWVSGRIGDAALGLLHLRGELALDAGEAEDAVHRLERPTPRVALGQALRSVASAAIDVSDGLVADLGHIGERSAVRVVIEALRVPVPSVVRTRAATHPHLLAAALTGGDDYELCFTAPAAQRDALHTISMRLGLPLTEIGRIEAGAGVEVLDAQGRALALAQRGFDHFG